MPITMTALRAWKRRRSIAADIRRVAAEQRRVERVLEALQAFDVAVAAARH
jgi:hypothetical protein